MKSFLVLLCLAGLAWQAVAVIPRQSQETCDALSLLGSGATADLQFTCVTNDECYHVTCAGQFAESSSLSFLNSLGLQSSLTLLPCLEPDRVAVELTVRSSSTELDSHIYTESVTERDLVVSSIPVTLTVRLTQLPNGIEIAVEGSYSFFGFSGDFTLVPDHVIPVSTAGCSGPEPLQSPSPSPEVPSPSPEPPSPSPEPSSAHPQPSSVSPKPSSSAPLPLPSPTTLPPPPPPKDTCEALTQLAKDHSNKAEFTCQTNTACDGVECESPVYKAKMTVLPCNNPPGVHLIITDKREKILADEIVTKDTEIPIEIRSITATLSVTLDQLEDAVGIKIAVSYSTRTPSTLVEYTVIPIDTSTCDGVGEKPIVGDEHSGVTPTQTGALLVVSAAAIASLLHIL